ncbi:F-box protein [Citrus sinensis]|uniref:F-box protein n=1 Tax=Citrus sinensis TaxID=2711 RepID=A0ACB8MY11_CITSI|nr:F-box protein [Citrus sinensis]
MLLYLIIICFSLILFLNCLALKPLPPWARPTELRLLSLCFWKEISFFSIPSSLKNSLNITTIIIPSPKLSFKHMMSTSNDRVEEVSGGAEMSVLDLPELVLECILEKLPPSGLCNMAAVCSSLRDRCMSDHLWEKHMKQKWGRIVGPAAYREWQWHLASGKDSTHLKQGKQRLWMKLFSFVRSFSWVRSKVHDTSKQTTTTRLPVDSNSIMSWYLALETGRFWFPAQVYNRENGHVGFILSCYDAELSYDQSTDTFQARYPPHGRRPIAIECGVPRERLRAAAVDTSPHDLHISDCLNDLHPGDHIEIQWRRNKEFPYETLILEFNQYTPGSRWRKTTINRKDHREEGNEADGFYGGIRKVNNEEEIKMWKRLWPVEVLE